MPRRQGLITVNVPTMNEFLYGKPKKKRKSTTKKTTSKKTSVKKVIPTKREAISMFWKEKIIKKQRSCCAGKDCAKIHNGKKMKVDIYVDFDHIKPLALGGKHVITNIQALCAGCHKSKTREDRFNISQYKKKLGTSATKGSKTIKPKPKMVTVVDIFGNKKRVSINKTKVTTNIFGNKVRVLKD